MARTVYIESPDGSIQPWTDVPDNISDESVAKRYGGKVVDAKSDILRSAVSGVPHGLTQLGLLAPKLIVGAGGGLANLVGSEKGKDYWLARGKEVQRAEAAADELTGSGYTPTTKAGEYAKAITSGMVQLPVSRNPLTWAIDAMLGGAGGAAATAASDQGYGPIGTSIAAMAPFGVKAGLQAATPSFGLRKARQAVEALTPNQRATIETGMRAGEEAGVNPALWQVAPEGSQLRTMGTAVAKMPGAEKTQARVVGQLKGEENAATRAAISAITDPMWNKADVPIGPWQAEAIANAVGNVARERALPAGDVTGQAVAQQAARIGANQKVKVPQQQLMSELLQVNAQLRQTPTPQLRQRQQELLAILGGNAPWPTTQAFQPNVRSLRELETIRQDMGGGEGNFLSSSEGTQAAMRQALRDTADLVAPDAGYVPLLKKEAELSQAVRDVAETAKATAGKVQDPLSMGSRLDVAPELFYAAATSPLWALVPPARRWAQTVNARNLDNLLQSTSIEELAKKAARDPQRDALITALRMIAAPAQAGELQTEDLVKR